MSKYAMISSCQRYRYTLERIWGSSQPVLFIGLNPSTADAEQDDPTIRRCVGFAREWGYGGLLMGNLFAFRATDPAIMAATEDPIGPDNDYWLTALSHRTNLIIAAWGAHPMAQHRAQHVLKELGEVKCLGVTKNGYPRHPLYLPKTALPTTYSGLPDE